MSFPPRARRAAAAVISGVALAAALLLTGPARVHIPVGDDFAHSAPARVTGVHASETHYGWTMRWTDGWARIEWPSVFGFVPVRAELILACFPGRDGDQVTITVDGSHVSRHTMGGDWDHVTVGVPASQGPLILDVRSLTHHVPNDPRALGVLVRSVTLENGGVRTVLRGTPWWQVLVVALVGALTVAAGASAGGGMAGGIGALLLLGGLLAWARPSGLQASALVAFAGAAGLGTVTRALLVRHTADGRVATLTAVGVALPFLVLTLVVTRYFVDVPRWDVWELVPLIAKYYEGALTLGDIWGPHNAHRPATGRLLLLANVAFARWNHWIDLAMNLIVGALQMLVLVAFVAHTQRRTTRVHPASLVAVAVLVFTLMQWENWLHGWQVVLLVGALAVTASLLLLTDGGASTSRTAAAAGLGLVGTASFASCLLVWPLGALAILLRRTPGWPRQLAGWIVISIIVVAAYMWGLPRDPAAAPEGAFAGWSGLLLLVRGVLVGVGTPMVYRVGAFMGPSGWLEWSVYAAGAAACLLALAVAVVRWRSDDARECTWLFPVLLCLFGIGAEAMAATGRVWMSVQAMSASRYVVFGSCVWIGLTLLLAMSVRGEPRAWRVGRAVLLAVLTAVAADNWRHPAPHMEALYLHSSQGRAALLRDDIHAAASVLYPDPGLLQARRAVLETHGLSVFRPGAR